MTSPFALAPDIQVAALAEEFRQTGRVRIQNFLADPEPLRNHLTTRGDWRQLINSGSKVFELDRATRAGMTPERSAALDDAVYEGAATGFQYRFESLRVPDGASARALEPTLLNSFAAWMSGGDVRVMLREICGTAAIGFADAQATLFSPGDFLTGHDDEVAGKHRHAAYVFGLTPVWRAEWGGLLLFHEHAGRISGQVPGYNTLDLFRVPQMHSVSLVSPAAVERRLSITGWLRSGDE